jgi:hypothetical protein
MRSPRNCDTALGDLTSLALQQVGNCAQGGGLARAIAAQEGHNATLWHLQGHAFEHQDDVVVNHLNTVDAQDHRGRAHGVFQAG